MASSEEQKSAQKGERFLRKAERQVCWGARDKFWECMTKNNEQVEKCADLRKEFEGSCPPTWVTHFDRKFQFEKFKTTMAKDGYKKTDERYEQTRQKASN